MGVRVNCTRVVVCEQECTRVVVCEQECTRVVVCGLYVCRMLVYHTMYYTNYSCVSCTPGVKYSVGLSNGL